jgi:GxxExxY protein
MPWQEVNPGAENEDPLTRAVIGAAIEVHEALGPGLLESAYEACLAHELRARGIPFRTQVELPIVYRGHDVGVGYRLDFLIEDRLIVELKAVEKLLPIHEAQVLTYLRLSGKRLALLLNFNTPYLKGGIKRLVL